MNAEFEPTVRPRPAAPADWLALQAERDGLMQTLRDEMDENLRLRELGGAGPDENITAMTERLIRERNALRAQLAIAARGLKHCAGWNIHEDKRNALMSVVLESEALLAPGPNASMSGPQRPAQEVEDGTE